MSAFGNAVRSSGMGLSDSYPCLIWLADYVEEAIGSDPAARWRLIKWDKRRAARHLLILARKAEGSSPVERALRYIARQNGWRELATPAGVCIGVFNVPQSEGSPAIWDGDRRWLTPALGDATFTLRAPDAIWQVSA